MRLGTSERAFLDTNVFVYSFDAESGPKAGIAGDLIRHAVVSQQGVVSYQVVQEFFNFALRKFSHPMGIAESQQYLLAVFRPLLAVESSPALFADALHLQAHDRLSWYDALIVAAAIQAKCKYLLSEDMQDGRSFGNLQIRNPFR